MHISDTVLNFGVACRIATSAVTLQIVNPPVNKHLRSCKAVGYVKGQRFYDEAMSEA